MNRRVAIVTNNSECERHIQYYSTMEKYLTTNGWSVEAHFDVEKVLVCACGFHDFMLKKIEALSARLKSIGYPEKDIVITGCLPGTHPANLVTSFPGKIVPLGSETELDSFFGNRTGIRDIPVTHDFKAFASKHEEPMFHIKIAQGCLRKCTFCVINKAKGALTSVPVQDIRRQFNLAVENGYRRIFLMAEDTFAYGLDSGTDIIRLVNDLAATNPNVAFHFGSLHVWWLDKYAEGIVSLCEQDRVKHLHVGLQHVNPEILKAMGREVRFDNIHNTLRRIRAACPKLVLSADILVGFPGETEEKFNELIDFFQQDECFNQISHFGFSDVKGAPSHHFKDKTDPLQIAARWDKLRKVLGARSLYNRGDRGNERYRQAYISTFNDDFSFIRDSYRDIENVVA